MKILKMTLDNFQGIKHFEFEPNGKDIDIYGENGTGKTTLANAHYWLLFGKPSTDEKNYTPETVESTEKEHSVTVLFSDNEKKIELKKILKKHGKSSRTECYIDDLGVKQKEFDECLIKICPISVMKQLAREDTFLSDTPDSEKRITLFNMAGGVDEDQVFFADKKFGKLKEMIGEKDVESYQKYAKDKVSRIKKEIGETKGKISGLEESLRNFEDRDYEKELESLKKQKSEIETRLNAGKDEVLSDLRKKIAEKEAEKAKAKSDYHEKVIESRNKALARISDLEEAKRKNREKEQKFNLRIKDKENVIRGMNIERERLIAEWKKVNAEFFEKKEISDICPCCGQKLPPEKLKETRDKYEEQEKEFNVKKSNRLEEISKAGGEVSKEKIEEQKEELEKVKEHISFLGNEYLEICEQIEEAKKESAFFDFSLTAECEKYNLEINKLKEKLEGQEEKTKVDKSDIIAELDEANKKIESIMQTIAEMKVSAENAEKVEEYNKLLKEQEKEKEEFEYGLYLCTEFSKKKSELMEEKVNSMFKNLKFRLFKEQVNSEIKEDCEALILCEEGYIPYTKANHAAKVRAGLEIISALSEFYHVEMPVFIDNAESITGSFPETAFQQIRLHAKENEKGLRCEYV